ncbi:hypothetical protein D1007_05936 [Hordeum vulgare]|nr:hypothetical protein D1007_05936 [Hordeum vulgare]
MVGFPDVELRVHVALHTICGDGFEEPLATPEDGFAVLAAERAVNLEDTVIQVDKILDSVCRDLFSEAATCVFSHLHFCEPGFDFNSVIPPVPTETRDSAAEVAKGPVEALVKRFACVAVPPSLDAAEADGRVGDATDDDNAPLKGEVTGGGGSS